MDKQIHIVVNKEKQGPYFEAQIRDMLRSGQITGSTLAWHKGLSNWMPLSSVLDSEKPPEIPSIPVSYSPETVKKKTPWQLWGAVGACFVSHISYQLKHSAEKMALASIFSGWGTSTVSSVGNYAILGLSCSLAALLLSIWMIRDRLCKNKTALLIIGADALIFIYNNFLWSPI